MTKIRIAIAALVAAGLAGSPVAYAKTYKHNKHPTTSSEMKSTTGTNMKSPSMKSTGGSSQGNVGPGTNNNSGPQPGGR